MCVYININIYINIFIHVYVNVFIYIYIYIYIDISKLKYSNIHTNMYICTHTHIKHVCMYAFMHAYCACIHTYKHSYLYMQIYVLLNIHDTCIYISYIATVSNKLRLLYGTIYLTVLPQLLTLSSLSNV